jgi:D-xylose transport system substrate-binding protein
MTLTLATAALVIGSLAGCNALVATKSNAGGNGDGGANTVAMLMSDSTTSRWFQVDVPNVKAAMKKELPGSKVLTFNAQSSPDTQLTQARTAIGQGARVLIVESVDPTSAGSIVKLAHQSNVKVIAYVHGISKAPIDYFVGFDPIALGQEEGKWVAENTADGDSIVLINGWQATSLAHDFRTGYLKELQPLFDSGKRKLVGEVFTPEWLADKAQSEMDAFLAKSNNNVDAVLSENDQMAGGVVASLKGAGLVGKVKVTGLDAEPAALQRILNGTQSMTIYPSFGEEAAHAAAIATALLKGKKPAASLFDGRTIDNGVGGTAPWAVTKTVAITKDNIDLVVKDGYITKEKLCNGITGSGYCS